MNLEITNPIFINGEKGLSIKSASTVNSDIVVTLSDDSTVTIPNATGAKGDTGIGIQSASINQTGHLVITLTDNSTITSTEQVRGPKGDNGTTGADVNGGSVTDNQITITKSDGSTVQLTGQINAASEAVGDMKATARNDVSTENYLGIERFVDVTYDKVNEPDLYPFFKEYQPNDLIYDVNDTFINNVNSYKATSIFNWKGKWVRTAHDNNYLLFQVSDTFDFLSFQEYKVPASNLRDSYRMCYIPEKNVIFWGSLQQVKRISIDNISDLNDYVEVVNGGNETKTPQIIENIPEYPTIINISDLPNNPECYLYFTDNSKFYYYNLQGCLDLNDIVFNSITKTDIQNNGYSVNSDLFMSMNKIYFYDSVAEKVFSKNVETDVYSTELDFTGQGLSYVSFLEQVITDGCLILSTNEYNYKINRYNNETVFKQLNRINNNVVINETIVECWNKNNIIIARISDTTGMSLDSNASDEILVSYDDGLSWNQIFYDPYRTYWTPDQKFTTAYGTCTRSFNELVLYVCGDNVGFVDGYSNHFFLIEFQEEGYSDLFTVQSLYLNDDVKGFLRRKP